MDPHRLGRIKPTIVSDQTGGTYPTNTSLTSDWMFFTLISEGGGGGLNMPIF